MSIQGSSTFDVLAARFYFVAREAVQLPETAGNLFRGQFGKTMKRRAPEMYGRFFAPRLQEGEAGPSGLKDPPRPFVFRVRHLDGTRFTARDVLYVCINLFQTRDPKIDLIRGILSEMVHQNLRGDFLRVEHELLKLPLNSQRAVDRVRVRFVTQTELKNAETPQFPALFARIRDRVSTLRDLYGPGPLEIDFKAMGERASAIRMTKCELTHVEVERDTGSRHQLGGFVGVAEYEGSLGEFLPYLEIAKYTGIGRHTVWGNGEIAIKTF